MESTKTYSTKRFVQLSLFLFFAFTAWRIYLIFLNTESKGHDIQVWAASYQLIAWFGALVGFYFSKLWGGSKSIIGRANLAFAFGLLAQSFGQSVFSYYFYKGIELPYPSLADIGFFGSIPFYIYGIALLAKVSGVHFTFKSVKNKILAIIIPLILLFSSYFFFLKGYEFDWSSPLRVFLDLGYPLGQAIYISIAIVAYLLSINFLGGIMRKPILLFIFALFVQYISDFTFLYQASRGIFVGGGIVDYLYLVSYFVMSLSLIKLGLAFYKIKNS